MILAGFVRYSWSEAAIDLGSMLNSVNTDQLLGRIYPIQDSIIAYAQFTQSRKIFRHPDKPPMHHYGRVLRKPLDFAFDTRAKGGVEVAELGVSFAAYFDPVGHFIWRGFQGLNLPALSSWRAARSSAMTLGFCAVSQSCNSSRFSTEERTLVGISTVSVFTKEA